MRIKNTLMGLGLGLLLSGTANAAFILTIDDLSTMGVDVSITDGGTGDGLPGDTGAILYSGSIGVFTVNVTTGISKPLAASPQLMHLDNVSVSSGGAGQLEISVTDTGFGPTSDPFSLEIEATVIHTAGGQVSSFDAQILEGDPLIAEYGGTAPPGPGPGIGFDFCLDDANGQYACDAPGPKFSPPPDSGPFSGSGPIVPIPPAVWLFGSGLLGLVGVARRRSRT